MSEGFIGLAEFRRNMEGLGRKVADDVLPAALRAAAEVVRDAMEAAAPVGTRGFDSIREGKTRRGTKFTYRAVHVPGTLRRNIIVQQGGKGKLAKSDTENAFYVGPSWVGFYGYFLEYGTSKMAARPFARRSFDGSREDAMKAAAAVAASKLAGMA